MYKLLGGLKNYFKWQDIQTDNAVFRLHNIFTTVLLLTCSLIITATQYVGQPISCIVSGIPTHVVNTFCWISSTFTMPDAFRRQVSWLAIRWIKLMETPGYISGMDHYKHINVKDISNKWLQSDLMTSENVGNVQFQFQYWKRNAILITIIYHTSNITSLLKTYPNHSLL